MEKKKKQFDARVTYRNSKRVTEGKFNLVITTQIKFYG